MSTHTRKSDIAMIQQDHMKQLTMMGREMEGFNDGLQPFDSERDTFTGAIKGLVILALCIIYTCILFTVIGILQMLFPNLKKGLFIGGFISGLIGGSTDTRNARQVVETKIKEFTAMHLPKKPQMDNKRG